MKPQLLIGAATSGSGKTTFTMGLLRALHKRGLRVQPFKCGPDYIDTQFHTLAADHESVNLDTWMASNTHVQHLYNKYGDGADVCVTEGVMGLFDGYQRMQGSSAEIQNPSTNRGSHQRDWLWLQLYIRSRRETGYSRFGTGL